MLTGLHGFLPQSMRDRVTGLLITGTGTKPPTVVPPTPPPPQTSLPPGTPAPDPSIPISNPNGTGTSATPTGAGTNVVVTPDPSAVVPEPTGIPLPYLIGGGVAVAGVVFLIARALSK